MPANQLLPLETVLNAILPVRAGPVTARFQESDGMLRRIMLGDMEICRGIYGALRDANWDTVTPRLEGVNVDQGERRFAITFTAVCRAPGIRYRWQGRITGGEDGTIRYTFDGVAEAPFRRNRIGLCVLHPVRGIVGRGCHVVHADGSESTGSFPLTISPHQPFMDIRSLGHQTHGGVDVTVRFEGEVFEMEDQRNWTDASFKTYGTPLSLPFPVPVEPGAEVRQSVQIELRGSFEIAPSRKEYLMVEIGDWGNGHPWTPVGLQASPWGRILEEREAEALAALKLSHLRIEVDFGREDWRRCLRDGLEECHRLKTSPLPAFTVSDAAADELEAARAVLDEEGLSPAGVIVFHRDEKVTGERWLTVGDRIFKDLVIGGTNAYFAELNRQRPSPESAAKRRHAFSMNPQVHAFDDLSVMETLEAQPWTLNSARMFCRQPLLISPITLLPRFNPNATEAPTAWLPQNDPRQKTPFGATWTLGSLAAVQGRSDVHALTYHQTVGGAGLLDGDDIYPVYDLLAAVTGATHVVETTMSTADRGRLAALAILRGEERRLLLGNLTDAPMEVAWRESSSEFGKIHLDPYGWENLAR